MAKQQAIFYCASVFPKKFYLGIYLYLLAKQQYDPLRDDKDTQDWAY